jgi:hypothetical protein
LGLEEALRRLRYVPRYPLPGSEVRSEDHNSIVDALKALSAECRARMPGDPLVDALDAAIAKLRYLRTGDIYEASDHNDVVDALKVARDVLARLESYYAARAEELKGVVAGLMDVAGGLRLTYFTWYPPLPPAVSVGLADVAFEATYFTWYPPILAWLPPAMNVRLVVDFVDAPFEADRPIAEEAGSEPVTVDAGNVATNISDSATA